MGRKKKEIKLKETVRIREKKLSDGNISLYLDMYYKGIRKKEGLKLYILPETSPMIKMQNANTRKLAEQIKAHSFEREYQTVVYGGFKTEGGTVDAPIGRHSVDRKKMCVTEKNSKPAVTHYEVIERYSGFTHLRVHLETGRTHQIRVHMAYIGHPVAGDPVYGPKKVITELHGQCLHAGLIGFRHPRTGKHIEVRSELPEYFEAFLRRLDK